MNEGMEGINQLDKIEKRWFAVYTKFKCEKYVHEQLEKHGVESYVPLLKRTKQYVSKKKEYYVPLINCYVFVCIDRSEYVEVLQTQYVLKFIRQGSDLIAIPEDEMNLMKKIVGGYDVELNQKNFDYTIGQKVEIISGELTGLSGYIIESQNKKDFLVELQTIGVQLRVQVDKDLLRPAVHR